MLTIALGNGKSTGSDVPGQLAERKGKRVSNQGADVQGEAQYDRAGMPSLKLRADTR
eukprot:CAMPEP_0202087510 /NCGR_PEP_ID=MMETSP0964-20121228/36374_1 /ASSEMBLY_ACC=CAM_ASM_000500 /TAXON_ID=4773 /ORGANISM="Schizochytrium aggregatum, Strain ATCC28209" /LENGTH=56 /DNA_ID=CAMNT_0048655477 /DNA_START=13 /DNA_END=183 /DNA_ORIENTATION=-